MSPGNRETTRIIGARIRAARRRAGLRQEAIAEQLGVRQSSVSQWERGHTRPSLEHLLPLATALGVQLEELLETTSELAEPAIQHDDIEA